MVGKIFTLLQSPDCQKAASPSRTLHVASIARLNQPLAWAWKWLTEHLSHYLPSTLGMRSVVSLSDGCRIPFSLSGSCYCNHILFKNKQMDKPKISSLSSYALAAPPLYLLLKQCTHSQEVFRLSHCLFRTSAHRQMSIVDPDKQYLGVSGRVPRCCADKSIMHRQLRFHAIVRRAKELLFHSPFFFFFFF